jgi:hypothetical protein
VTGAAVYMPCGELLHSEEAALEHMRACAICKKSATVKPPQNRPGRTPKPPETYAGTVTGYANHGLRDPASRKAWADYIAKRRKARRKPQTATGS